MLTEFTPQEQLPPPRSMEHWRERVISRFFGRLCQADFDHAFDIVVKWLDGREVDLEQAYWSSVDIFIACCRVYPEVILQECELTGVQLITMRCRNQDGRIKLSRTRRVTLLAPGDTKPPIDLTTRDKKKRA